MLKRWVSLGVVAVLATGCQTVDPYTGEQKTSKATVGAGVGAAAGAVVGVLTSSKKDRKKGALTGALVGGAVGGGVGYYMDQQEAALRKELLDSGVQVERNGDEIRLVMPGNITFPTGSHELNQSFSPVLDSVVKVLVKFDQTQLVVDGFTDSQGAFEYNQQLSEHRAQAVANYLRNAGVEQQRLESKGWGERYPVADNGTEAGRAANRRVELNIRSFE